MGSRLGLVARRSYSLLWLHPTAVANGSLTQLAMPGSARAASGRRDAAGLSEAAPAPGNRRLSAGVLSVRLASRPRSAGALIRTPDRTQRRAQGTRRRAQHGRTGRARGARLRQTTHREADSARRSERRIVRTAAGVARGLSDRAQDRGARSRSHRGASRAHGVSHAARHLSDAAFARGHCRARLVRSAQLARRRVGARSRSCSRAHARFARGCPPQTNVAT